MPTHHYFHRVDALKTRPPKPPKVPKVKRIYPREFLHSTTGRRMLILTLPNGQTRFMTVAAYTRSLPKPASCKGHRWTSEEARRMMTRLWATRWRRNCHSGRHQRRFVTSPRPPVDKRPLREYYRDHPTQGIQYMGRYGTPTISRQGSGHWRPRHVWSVTDAFGTRPISELAALRRLGHLRSPGKYAWVPHSPITASETR